MPAAARSEGRRASRWLALVGAAVAVAVLAGAAPPGARAAPLLPSADPFYSYTGTTPLASVAPGTVLKTRAISLAVSGSSTAFSAEQLLYRTTGEQGQPTVTVTTLLKPLVSVLGTRLVAYQTAYDGLGGECDPSYTLAGGNPSYGTAQDEATIIEAYLTAGFTVEVSDYEGERLEWAAGQESGYGTLDGIRASEHALGLPASAPVALVGYSGGSIATEWASELAPSYAPELDIIGAAEGGIPVDLAHNLAYVNGSSSWSGVIPAVLVALSRAFGLPLNDYLSAYGRTVTAQVASQCINSFLGAYPGLTVQRLLKPQYQNILAVPAFARVIDRLIMGTTPGHPSEPLLMAVGDADGTGDGVMVAGDVEALAHEYCEEGVPVDFAQFTGSSHEAAAIPFETSALTFVLTRFLGLPAFDGCSSLGPGNSLAPLPVAATAGCPLPSGMLAAGRLGFARVGMTRAQVRRAYAASTMRRGHDMDTFCLTPDPVRVGYTTAALAARRRGVRTGTVVWASTANPFYALSGVSPGTSAAAARRRLELARPIRVGAAAWYFTRRGASVGVLEAVGGRVAAVGVAAPGIASGAAGRRALVRAFG